MDQLNQLIDQAKKDFASCSKLAELDHIKSKFLGKSGPITEAMKSLASLSPEEKPKKGAEINQVEKQIVEKIKPLCPHIYFAKVNKQFLETNYSDE